jgi:hypothetical protein
MPSMLRDRVVSLRKANVFEPRTYWHMTSALEIPPDRQAERSTCSRTTVVVQT